MSQRGTARPPGRPPYPGLLTPAEWRVVGCVREGLSNAQIAETLGVTRATVRSHLVTIYSKLGLENREDLVRFDEDRVQAAPDKTRGVRWAFLPAVLGHWHAAKFLKSAAVLSPIAVPAFLAAVLLGYWFQHSVGSPQGTAGDPPPVTETPQVSEEVWAELESRPLAFAQIGAGAACPVTPVQEFGAVDNRRGPGAGPVIPWTGSETVAFSTTYDNTGRGAAKIRWWVSPEFSGPALVRGGRLDGAGTVEFEGSGELSQLRLTGAPQTGREPTGFALSTLFVPQAGCYALQIDTPDSTEVIVFAAQTYAGRPPQAKVTRPGRVSDTPFAVVAGGITSQSWIFVNGRAAPVSAGRDATWSPDGARLAWVGDEGLFVAEASDPGSPRLVAPGRIVGAPSWSSDGARLVVSVASDSGGARLATADVGKTASIAYLTDGSTFDWAPAWSPGGRSIAFVRGSGASADVQIIDVDSRAVTRLTRWMLASRPAWSPDGRSIAFESRANGRESAWVVGADGTGAVELSQGLRAGVQPAWAADGTSLLFSGAEQQGFDVYRVNPDGNGRRLLTDDPGSEWAPEWVGAGIVRYLSSANGPAELWEIDIATLSKTRLTETAGGAVIEFAGTG